MIDSKFGSLEKSHISQHKVLVRFVNRCPWKVIAYWVNFKGEEVKYSEIGPGERSLES